jgi:hypothetical protein
MKHHAHLFPIDGQVMDFHGGTWRARVVSTYASALSDRVLFKLLFTSLEEPPKSPISLDYWLSFAGLTVELDTYASGAKDFLVDWLSWPSSDAEAHFYGINRYGPGHG